MARQPSLDRWRFVSSVVIQHQMEIQRGGKFLVQMAEKLQKFLMPVARYALPDDLAVQHAERGKKGGSPVAFVVVSHRSATALFERQARLSSIQGLNLAFFIDAKH